MTKWQSLLKWSYRTDIKKLLAIECGIIDIMSVSNTLFIMIYQIHFLYYCIGFEFRPEGHENGRSCQDSYVCNNVSIICKYFVKADVSSKKICIYDTWYMIYCRFALTYWGRDLIATISQTTFSNAFSWMKMYEFRLKFHESLFLSFELTIFSHWFR